ALLRGRIDDGDLRRVLRAHLSNRDLRPERVHAPALAEAHRLLRWHPAEVDHRRDQAGGTDHWGARAPRQLGRVARPVRAADQADVVTVAVGHEDHVYLAERVEVLVLLRRLRVPGEERVDDDDLAGERRQLGRRLTQPVDLDLRRLRPGRFGRDAVGESAGGQL